MRSITTILITALILVLGMGMGCSNASMPTDQNTALTSKAAADILASGTRKPDVVLYWSNSKKSLIPNQFLLFEGDVVAIIIPPMGKLNITDQSVIECSLNGVEATKFVTPNQKHLLQFMDYTDDVETVAFFEYHPGSAVTSGVGEFIFRVDDITFAEDRTYDWEFIDRTRNHSALRSSDNIVLLDAKTGKFFPNGFVVRDDETIGVIVRNSTSGSACGFDHDYATLNGAPENHVSHFALAKNDAGVLGHLMETHFMGYTDNNCKDPVVHFNVSQFFNDVKGFGFKIYGWATFPCNYRLMGGARVEMTFEDHWVWNQTIVSPLAE